MDEQEKENKKKEIAGKRSIREKRIVITGDPNAILEIKAFRKLYQIGSLVELVLSEEQTVYCNQIVSEYALINLFDWTINNSRSKCSDEKKAILKDAMNLIKKCKFISIDSKVDAEMLIDIAVLEQEKPKAYQLTTTPEKLARFEKIKKKSNQPTNLLFFKNYIETTLSTKSVHFSKELLENIHNSIEMYLNITNTLKAFNNKNRDEIVRRIYANQSNFRNESLKLFVELEREMATKINNDMNKLFETSVYIAVEIKEEIEKIK